MSRPRILSIPGAGDVFGTFKIWRSGEQDRTLPSLTYSAHLYDVCAKRQARLHVLNPEPVGENENTVFDVNGLSVSFSSTQGPTGQGWRYHANTIFYAFKLALDAVRMRAEVVVVQHTLTHFWPLGLLRFFGIKTVMSLHNTLWPASRAPSRKEALIHKLNAGFFRRCTRVLCVSRQVENQLAKIYGETPQNTRIHVPQYESYLKDIWRDRSQSGRLQNLLYLGRIEPGKGIFDLLTAFEHLAGSDPDMTLTFLGSGGASDQLTSKINTSTFHARISFPGAVNGDGVYDALHKTDLLICPTTSRFSEGLAKTPIEAALCGVPSLLTTAVPVAEILEGAVTVTAPDDPSKLSAEITRLKQDPEAYRRMVAATFLVRDKFFDFEQSFGKVLEDALMVSLPTSKL